MDGAIVEDDIELALYDSMDGPSEEEVYLAGMYSVFWSCWRRMSPPLVGEYKTILQLVGVLSHGKIAKLLTDHAIDLMQDVQNLRKAIYE